MALRTGVGGFLFADGSSRESRGATPRASYRDLLLASHRRHIDDMEANGAAPLTELQYRNQRNRRLWRERYQRYFFSASRHAAGAPAMQHPPARQALSVRWRTFRFFVAKRARPADGRGLSTEGR